MSSKWMIVVALASAVVVGTAMAQTAAGAQAAGSASSQTEVSSGPSGAQVKSQSAVGANVAASASHDDKHQGSAAASGSAKQATSGSANAGNANLSAGSTVNAVLNKSVDVKKNKPGDEVTAKVTQDVKSSANGSAQVVIPKGSRLVGHVTEARPREKGRKAKGETNASGQADSRLGIAFDKAILKNGQEVPFSAVIQAVGATQQNLSANGAGSDVMETTSAMGAGSASAGNRGGSGGGMLGGGAVGSTLGATTSTVGNTVGGAGGAVDSTLNASASAAGSVGRATGAATSASGQLSSSARGVVGLQGLQLASAASGATQGSLITSGTRDVHLDSGTQMVLRVTGSAR